MIDIQDIQLEQGYTPHDRGYSIQSLLLLYLRSKLQSSRENRGFNRGIQNELDYYNEFSFSEIPNTEEIPSGRLAEIFFLVATNQIGLDCSICAGDDDAMGKDFIIKHGNCTSGIDVTINCYPIDVSKKILKSKTPVIFLPWDTYNTKNGANSNYLGRYIDTGVFNGREYLEIVYSMNNKIYENIRSGKKDTRGNTRIMLYHGEIYIKKCPDKVYLSKYKTALDILNRSLYS